MADLHQLVTMLKELDDQLVGCMRCGMCQAVCPVFAQTGREADVARGKLALLDGLAHEMIKDPKAVKQKLERCLVCGTCSCNCPSGVKAGDIFLKARAILTGYLGLHPVKKLVFKGLLNNPKLFNTLLEIGGKFQGLFTKQANDIIGSSCGRFQAPVIADRHFRGLAEKPFHASHPSLMKPAGKSGLTVAFYPGCVVDKMFPQVGEAMLKIFDHFGVGVVMPDGQACCGIPALSSGDVDDFKALVKRNLKVFEGQKYDYLITPCATCTSTMAHLWPEWAGDDIRLAGPIKEMTKNAMDISQFLVDVLKVELPAGASGNGGQVVTYHDPCHLKNSMGVTAQPRKLLASLKGWTFKEMEAAGTCCGNGGSFNLHNYELSKSIGTKKAQYVIDSGAGALATSCPACMMQFTDFLSRKGARVRVAHVAELVAESL